MVVGGWKTTMEDGSETPWLLQCVSVKVDKKTAQQAFTAARNERTRRRQAKGILRSAVKEECVVVLWCVRNVLHLFQRKCVCVPRCLDRLFPLTQHEICVGRCSASLTVLPLVYFSSILAMFSNFKKTWQTAMMRSINLAMTNCLENKYINIYI